MQQTKKEKISFTGYQKAVIAILAFLQFIVIIDFMILSPLGAILLEKLDMQPVHFGAVVSAYAFSAGIAGILAAGFADKFDRKKLLLFFYVGFLLGTLACGLSTSFHMLLVARIIAGLFGGVIGAIVMAIIADLFDFKLRGRVMGMVQAAFAASQILGIPAGIYIANAFGWEMTFFIITAVGVIAGIMILFILKPIDAHLAIKHENNPLQHLIKTIKNTRYLFAFSATALLSIGGFLLMPFSSAFTVHNLGIEMNHLPLIFLATGIATLVIAPVVGKLSDSIGAYKIFVIGSIITVAMVLIYTHLSTTPIIWVLVVNILMFAGIFARMIPSQTMMSAIPVATDRGAFMSISNSVQQLAGGVSAAMAGFIVMQNNETQHIENFEIVGYILIITTIITMVMLYIVDKSIKHYHRNGSGT